MKASLDRYPLDGISLRVLITQGFIARCPGSLVDALQPLVKCYGIEAIAMPHLPVDSMRTWCRLNKVALVEWPRPEWMGNAVEIFRPNIVLAAPDNDPLVERAKRRETPVLIFED